MSVINKIARILFLNFNLCLLASPIYAQEAPVTADGSTATQINTNDNSNFDINGGDRAGGNLFHSFGNFSVPNAGSANFLNSPDVQNIINRVTGGNISDIQGAISAQGAANLFLINPAGIVFGPNASLNIGGSFLGSTADKLLFNDGTEFNATQTTKPLLTINAPIGLGIRDNPGNITNQASQTGLQVDSGKSIALVGGNVSLDGGFISAPGGIVALGGLTTAGEIRLNDDGSLNVTEGATRGNVSLTNDAEVSVTSSGGGTIAINVQNLELSNSSLFAEIASGFGETEPLGGNINIDATGSALFDNSVLSNTTFTQGDSGKITIKANGAVDLSNNSNIFNNVESQSKGNVGGISISADSLSLTGGSQLQSGTFSGGQGSGGTVDINVVNDIKFAGKDQQENSSGIFTDIEPDAVGNAGDIQIRGRSLTLEDGAILRSRNSGTGNAGKISIDTTDAVSFSNSTINSLTEGGGKGGDIDVKAKSLSLSNNSIFAAGTGGEASGSEFPDSGNINIDVVDNISLTGDSSFNSSTLGIGNGGDITINAGNSVSLDNSQIGSVVGGTGTGGTIDITANFLNFNSGGLVTSTIGQGDAGNIQLKATDSISANNNSILQAVTLGEGNAGNITIDSPNANISLDKALITSSVAKDVINGQQLIGTGKGGNIQVSSRSLSLANGANLLSSTFGEGGGSELPNAGNITINVADNLSVTGNSSLNSSTAGIGNGGDITINAGKSVSLDNSKIGSVVGGTGKGGTVDITAGSLNFNSGGLLTSTLGQGDAGNIQLKATDSISASNSSILQAVTFGEGNAGNITIDSPNANIFLDGNGTFLSAFVGSDEQEFFATGRGGNIQINSRSLSLSNGASLLNITFTKAGQIGVTDAGDININTGKLSLTDGGFITTSTAGIGNAGKINIQATEIFADRVGNSIFGNGIFSTVEQGAVGNSDGISITTDKLSLKNGARISSSTFGQGNAGNVEISANSIDLDKGSILAANNPSTPLASNNGGGEITLNVKDRLVMRNGSKVSAQASGNASGGNVKIDAKDGFIVAFPNQDNDILASSQTGQAGKISISAERVFGFDKPQRNLNPQQIQELLTNGNNDINASSGTSGLEGIVSIESPDVNPTQGIEQSPEQVVEPDETVSQACSGSGDIARENSFTIVGRGGLPSDPTKPLNSSIVAGNLGSGDAEVRRGGGAEEKQALSSDEIVPARGMTVNSKGQVVLTRYPTPNTSDRPLAQTDYCSDRASNG
jgi:filamentous hemagglutinin family protein